MQTHHDHWLLVLPSKLVAPVKVLIVGSGAREHALAWRIKRSPNLTRLWVAGGNAGTAALAENLDIRSGDVDALVAAARELSADLVVVGPEAPLALGLADRLDEPVRLVRQLVDSMERADLVRGVLSRDDEEIAFVPARPIHELTMGAVLRTIRGEWKSESGRPPIRSTPVAETLDRLEGAWSELADQTSLEMLARTPEEDVSGGGA